MDTIEPKNPHNPFGVKKDKMVMIAIYQAISKEILLSIAEKHTTKEVWETLKIMYMGVDQVRTTTVQ